VRLEADVEAILDRRLSAAARRPLAVAVSGGGDSVALALLCADWARTHGRELLLLNVDHRLQSESPAWTRVCRDLARRLGARFEALDWTGDKPATGLPAAARRARHALLAEAARASGAWVILMGHTADDVLEARAMRQAGATTPDPRVWSPSPAWPEGRDIFLLRPLIGVRRDAIRAWLAERGQTWIDDPANMDPRYARARARAAANLGDGKAPVDPAPLGLARQVLEVVGGLRAPRAVLRRTDMASARRLLAMAAVCAGGGDRLPAAGRVARLADLARSESAFTATLSGARIEADADTLAVWREAGEAARGGLAELPLPAHQPVVWDGRYEIVTDRIGLRVTRLAGRARKLPPEQRRQLAALSAHARAALPVVLDSDVARSPALGDVDGVRMRPLVMDRFRAASGLVDREPD
jgi:tRNA(Ile)-lysidine synthase